MTKEVVEEEPIYADRLLHPGGRRGRVVREGARVVREGARVVRVGARVVREGARVVREGA